MKGRGGVQRIHLMNGKGRVEELKSAKNQHALPAEEGINKGSVVAGDIGKGQVHVMRRQRQTHGEKACL